MTASGRVVIRAADRKDIEPLSRLVMETYADAFGHTMGVSDLAHHLETHLPARCFALMLEADVTLVIEVEGRMIGYVQFGDARASDCDSSFGSQELRRLYIHREYQHRGYGRMLMDVALKHTRLLNAERVFLDVWEHNHGAQRFYRRYGFEVVGSRPFVVASGVATDRDLVMARSGAPTQRPARPDPQAEEMRMR